MEILHRTEVLESVLSDDQDTIFLDPLLEEAQIGNVTTDLRLGPDFLVSILTRKPYISVEKSEAGDRAIATYFQETRRDLGDVFILYPGQIVLATTLEYLSLPLQIYCDVLSRSSYTRLGLHINTMVQPGFRGCVPLELFNHGNNAVELVVGSRVCQVRFFKSSKDHQYLEGVETRKYYGDIRPTISKAERDPELPKLATIRERHK